MWVLGFFWGFPGAIVPCISELFLPGGLVSWFSVFWVSPGVWFLGFLGFVFLRGAGLLVSWFLGFFGGLVCWLSVFGVASGVCFLGFQVFGFLQGSGVPVSGFSVCA